MSSERFDTSTERLSRRLAGRSSRRTFLGRVGKAAVLVAGGPTLVGFLDQRAEARVCGQSGVSPVCTTFDCTGPGDVWGWCWYASPGCCANGGLKKICDCCRRNHPNVHGYCPAGHNVYCAAESCGHDPRVMYVPLERASGLDAIGVALSRSKRLPDGRGGTAVVGDGDDVLSACLAGPVAAAVDGPLLLGPRTALSPQILDELRRLAITDVKVVGPGLSVVVDDALRAAGVQVERLHTLSDYPGASAQVARFVMARTGVRRAFCVGVGLDGVANAPAAAAIAAARKGPLVLGVDGAIDAGGGTVAGSGTVDGGGADATAITYLVGQEVASRAGAVPGGFPLRGTTRDELAVELATLAVTTEGMRDLNLLLAPSGSAGIAPGLVGAGGVLLYHPDGALGRTAFSWLLERRTNVRRAVLGGSLGTLGTRGVSDLQSVLHGFDTHLLVGVGGQGLPVRSQPLDERPLGRARVKGELPPDTSPAYWSGRANPNR